MTNIVSVSLFVLLFVVSWRSVSGHPDGVDFTGNANVCNTMIPLHGAQSAEICPFTADIPRVNMYSFESIQITLNAVGARRFRGFMTMAFDSKSDSAGTFASSGADSKTLDCLGASAQVHTNKNDKNQLSFTWTPSPGFTGTVQIKTTFVENALTYWAQVPSLVITVLPSPSTTSMPTSVSSSTTESTTPTPTATSSTIPTTEPTSTTTPTTPPTSTTTPTTPPTTTTTPTTAPSSTASPTTTPSSTTTPTTPPTSTTTPTPTPSSTTIQTTSSSSIIPTTAPTSTSTPSTPVTSTSTTTSTTTTRTTTSGPTTSTTTTTRTSTPTSSATSTTTTKSTTPATGSSSAGTTTNTTTTSTTKATTAGAGFISSCEMWIALAIAFKVLF